jgi:hypothetical protein
VSSITAKVGRAGAARAGVVTAAVARVSKATSGRNMPALPCSRRPGCERRQTRACRGLRWQARPAAAESFYASTDFSGDEWDDPEKRERLATFERVIAEAERAEGGAPRMP